MSDGSGRRLRPFEVLGGQVAALLPALTSEFAVSRLRMQVRAGALCGLDQRPVELDADAWWPVSDAVGDRMNAGDAVALCEDCPVRARCTAWAILEGQDSGIWGGLLPAERRAIRELPTVSDQLNRLIELGVVTAASDAVTAVTA